VVEVGNAIEVENLTKFYGANRGIAELGFTVAPGEIFGYLGPNGAGKTTTIRLFLDLIRPTRGRATLLGLDARRDSVELHSRIGYLAGDLALYERLTAGEFLGYVANLRRGGGRDQIAPLSERLQLDLATKIGALSHGNKQKVGLVQAFMHRPELVILDEPTQGLDPLMQHEFYRLAEEAKHEGRSVFLSSHVMPEVERVCDRVGIIRNGRLVAVEDVGELKAKALRTVEFHFASPVPTELFERLPGVDEVEAVGDVVRCSVTGALDAVIKTAARFSVVDVSTHQSTLEDAFLTFYGKEPDDAA
jgi:ABC-2 type transport system ATP-binding protein